MANKNKFGNLKIHPAAEDFPLLNAEGHAALVADIRENGQHYPILVTVDGKMIVEGRNRYLACVEAGTKPKFKRLPKMSELQIVKFIWSANGQRRDLEPSQRAMIFLFNQERQLLLLTRRAAIQRSKEGASRGGKAAHGKSPPRVGPTKDYKRETDYQLAVLAQVGRNTMGSAKRLLAKSRGRAKQVAKGTKKLGDAWREQRAAEQASPTPKEKPQSKHMTTVITHKGQKTDYQLPKGKVHFNKTNDQVSWAMYTWNPVTGCLHDCHYCYAREGAEVNENLKPYYPFGFEPTLYEYRLAAPRNSAVPKEAHTDPRLGRVFVTSMGDLFGKWVPDDWIEKVFAAARENPAWEYLFLTKFPQRYVGLDLPPTAWLGTTVDRQYRVKIAEEAFRKISGVKVKWLSCEPLLEPLKFSDLSMFDWVVIGSQSETEQPSNKKGETETVPAIQPKGEWVVDLTLQAWKSGCRVYWKPNLVPEGDSQCPGMTLIQEMPKLSPRLVDAAE